MGRNGQNMLAGGQKGHIVGDLRVVWYAFSQHVFFGTQEPVAEDFGLFGDYKGMTEVLTMAIDRRTR